MAVLYLDNLSHDTSDAYLADGLTEEIILRLGQVQRLEVKSRFEVQRFRGHSALDPQLLGRSLNAAYLVTGSVQRSGDRVRLRVALVRAATRAQAWGDVIDRASSDLLNVESDIAREVVTAITGQLLPSERSRLARPLTMDPVAYEEYLRGLRALHSTFDLSANRSALVHFDRAIARDSGFAAAYAGVADVWGQLADGFVTGREGYGRCATAARQAIALDSMSGPPYALLAQAVLALEFDAAEAERLARHAIALTPGYGGAYNTLSQVLLAEGRWREGTAAAYHAWELDSLSSLAGALYVDLLIRSHQLDRAAAFLPRYRSVAPPLDGDVIEGRILIARGDARGGLALLRWNIYGGSFAGEYMRALLTVGDTAAARATVDSMLAMRKAGYFNPVSLAEAYGALGDVDHGIAWLQRAFEERTVWLTGMRTDPELASLRADPRYVELDRQLKY